MADNKTVHLIIRVSPKLKRTVWLALARIRSPEAVRYLEAAREALEKSPGPDAPFERSWLAHLLSKDFQRAATRGD